MGFQLHHGHSHGGHGHSHGGVKKTAEIQKNPEKVICVTELDTQEASSKRASVGTKSITSVSTPRTSKTVVPIIVPSAVPIKDTNNATDDLAIDDNTIPTPAIGLQAFYKDQLPAIASPTVTAASSLESANVQRVENINVRAAFIHVLGDMLQSVGVFIAAIVIYFKPEWAIVDPICTFVFSIIVLSTTFYIMSDALLVLMEGTPDYNVYAEVLQNLQNISGVRLVHNLRIWALSINKVALSVHLAVEPNANARQILQEANRVVHKRYHFFETTIQIEDYTPAMQICRQCEVPKK